MKIEPGALRNRPLLIDTNLLLLSVVGSFDGRLIGRGRLEKFDIIDFHRLQLLVKSHPKLCTTPHVLTEVSNLAGNMIDRRRHPVFSQSFAKSIAVLDERYSPANSLAAESVFDRLGLTDASISRCTTDGVTVLTEDFPLAGALQKRGLSVVNFNQLRPL